MIEGIEGEIHERDLALQVSSGMFQSVPDGIVYRNPLGRSAACCSVITSTIFRCRCELDANETIGFDRMREREVERKANRWTRRPLEIAIRERARNRDSGCRTERNGGGQDGRKRASRAREARLHRVCGGTAVYRGAAFGRSAKENWIHACRLPIARCAIRWRENDESTRRESVSHQAGSAAGPAFTCRRTVCDASIPRVPIVSARCRHVAFRPSRVRPCATRSEGVVAAIASRDAARAAQAATDFGIPRSFGSYQELLDDPNIDAIYNPLPNHLHVPWTVRALVPASTCCARSRLR